jgi:hypothetical protein
MEHDRWFREQVQGTMESLQRGEQKLLPHDQFWSELETYAQSQKTEPDSLLPRIKIGRERTG